MLKKSDKASIKNCTLYYKLDKPTIPQLELMRSMDTTKVTIAVGGLSSGKTSAALTKAIERLIERKYKRLILSSPVQPISIPFENILHSIIQRQEEIYEYIEYVTLDQLKRNAIKNALVIIDEIQYSNMAEIIDITSRLGNDSSLVLLGDTCEFTDDQGDFLPKFITQYHFKDDIYSSKITNSSLQLINFEPKYNVFKNYNQDVCDYFKSLVF